LLWWAVPTLSMKGVFEQQKTPARRSIALLFPFPAPSLVRAPVRTGHLLGRSIYPFMLADEFLAAAYVLIRCGRPNY